MTVGQKTWEIPFESWYLAETDQTCVQPSPDGMQGLLVGDVFFREYVVEFDMTGVHLSNHCKHMPDRCPSK